MQDNSINYDEKFLLQFIHNYDKVNDFCFNYQEFLGIILPITDDSYKKKEEESKPEEINIIKSMIKQKMRKIIILKKIMNKQKIMQIMKIMKIKIIKKIILTITKKITKII